MTWLTTSIEGVMMAAMTRGRTRAITAITTLALALALSLGFARCGGANSSTAPRGTTIAPGTPSPTLTVPGRPQERVTDVAASTLTEEEFQAIIDDCKKYAGVPDVNGDCPDFEAFTRALKKALANILRSSCPRISCITILAGHSASDPDVGVVRVVDQRPGSPACKNQRIPLCKGITVPAHVVAPLIKIPTSSTPTIHSTPSPSTGATSKPTTKSTTKPPPIKPPASKAPKP